MAHHAAIYLRIWLINEVSLRSVTSQRVINSEFKILVVVKDSLRRRKKIRERVPRPFINNLSPYDIISDQSILIYTTL